MAKKKKRYGYKDGDENARFAPGGSAASEWEEQQRQSFTMGRTINPSDTSKRFNTEQDIENYKPIKTETYQSYMAQKLAQAKANNPKSRVHITANDLSSYSNARAKLYNIDPAAELKSQSEFTSQYKSSVDKKARLNDMVQLAQGLDLGNTQDLVRRSYNDLGAVEGLANTRTNAEGLLKQVEEYRKLYGDSKELKVLEDRAKGIQDYINTNAKGGSAVSQAAYEELQAPTIQKKEEVRAKYNAINNANIEEKYGKAGDLGYEGVKNIKAETPAEADWKEEKQLQLDPIKKYEDNKKEIESLENDGKMPLGNQNGVGYKDEQEAKNDRINTLREQNTQILAQYAEDIIAKANLTDDERRKLETGRSFDLSDNEFRWDVGDKAKNEVTLNRKEMIDVLTKRGISKEEASLLLDYENELDKENERQAAINAGELRRRTDSEIGNLTEDIARTIGQPIISPLERVMGVSGEYAHAEQLGRQQAREKYYEDDAIGKALYDFGETAGTIVGSSLLGGAATVPFTTKAVEDSYYNALDKGASEEDAMNYAATNGITTGIIYGIGLKGVNKLLSKSVKGSVVEGLAKEIVEGKPTSSLGKAIIKNVGTNALKEGGIFAGLTTTTQVADTLNQVINLGKKSDFNQMVEAYKQQGMSEDEAWQNTVLDISKQIGQGALESFASGAILGAGGAIVGNARQAFNGGDRLPENTLLRSEEGTPLRDSQGREILDDNGQPIRVQQGLNIDSEGRVLDRNISEEVRVTQSENGVPIIDSSGNQVTVNGQPIRAERTTLSGVEAYNKLRNEYENARVGLNNIQERIEGLWEDYKQQGFSNPEEVADFEKVRAKFNKDYVHVVNKAKSILGEYAPISARDQQDLLEGRKKLEDFREDLETVNPSSEEVKAEVDELKAEVDTQIDNIDTVVETQEVATADFNEPTEIVEPSEVSAEVVEPTEVVETPTKRAENVDLSNLNDRQSEIAEIGAKYNLPEDTIKSMVANDNDQISPRLYANEYSKMYLLGKQETIDSIEDAIRRNPEVRDTIQRIGTQAAGSAFSEGNTPSIETILRPETKPKGRLAVDFQETLEEAKVHQVLSREAKASGIDIVVTNDMGKYTNQGKAQGIAFLNNGKIVLNRDVANILGTADHEILGHFGKALAPKSYKELASIIVDTYQKDLGIRGYDKFIQNLKSEAKEQGIYLTESDAQEEAIAYGLETMAMNTDAMEKFIDRLQDSTMTEAEKKTILDKLKEFVKHVIETLKQRLKDARVRTGTESMLKADIDAEKVAEAKLKVYEEIRSNLESMTEGEVSDTSKYSLTEIKDEYQKAFEEKDEKKAAELVKEYAAKKGYTQKVYHGTQQFGFTQIDNNKSSYGSSFYATDDLNTAQSYSTQDSAKKISDTISDKELKEMTNSEILDTLSAHYNLGKFKIAKTESQRKYLFIKTVNDFINSFNNDKNAQRFFKEEGVFNVFENLEKAYNDYKNNKINISELEKHINNETLDDYIYGTGDTLRIKKQNMVEAIKVLSNNDTYFYNDKDYYYTFNKNSALQDIQHFSNKLGNYQFYANTDNMEVIDAEGHGSAKVPYNNRFYELYKLPREKGISGYIIKNVIDDGGRSGKFKSIPATVYRFFNPTAQVKSADPFTYDDNGDLVPLEKRFNKNYDDIRYSMQNEGKKLSDIQQQLSNDYDKAVEDNDTEQAAKLVEQYAKSKGYDTKVYHGTQQFGFTKIDLDKSDDKQTFWATSDIGTAETYSGRSLPKEISKSQNWKERDQEGLTQLVKEEIDNNARFFKKGDIQSRLDEINESIEWAKKKFDEAMKTVESAMYDVYIDRFNSVIDDINTYLDNAKNTKNFEDWNNHTNLEIAIDKFNNIFNRDIINENTKVRAIEFATTKYELVQTYNQIKKLIADGTLDRDITYYLGNYVYNKEDLIKDLSRGTSITTGNYQFYADTSDFMEVDANNSNWNNIKVEIKNPSIKSLETVLTRYFSPMGYGRADSTQYNKEKNNFNVYFLNDDEGTFESVPVSYKGAVSMYNAYSKTTRDVAREAKANGYKGTLIKNVVDNGGRSTESYWKPADIYIFFNPVEQVKSADPITYDDNGNVIPLEERFSKDHDDIRYSMANEGRPLSEIPDVLDESGADIDDKGRKLTKDQVEYFKNSKVRLDGDLETTYHGTVSDFTVFDRQFANIEGDWGKGYYFTNDINDVKRNYATEDGADLTNKIEQRADILESVEGYEDLSYDERYDVARKEFIKGDARYIEAYLNITNPVYVDEAHPTLLFEYEDLEDYRTDSREDYDTDEEYNEALYYEVESNLIEPILDEITNEYQLDTRDRNELSSILYEAVYEGGITAQNLKDKINQVHIYKFDTEDEGIAGNEIARQVIESLGYDGIIDTTVSSKFRNMGLHPEVTHYITFNSNQAKNIDNKQPTTNEDIRLSLKEEVTDRDIDKFKALRDDIGKALKLTKGSKLDSKGNRKLAMKLRDTFGTKTPLETMVQDLEEIGTLIETKGIQNTDTEDRVKAFVTDILKSEKQVDPEIDNAIKSIRKQKIYLTDKDKKQITDYKQFWRDRFNTLNIVSEPKGAMAVDEFFSHLEQYQPEVYNAVVGDQYPDASTLVDLLNWVKTAKDDAYSLLDQYGDEAVEYFTNEVLNEYSNAKVENITNSRAKQRELYKNVGEMVDAIEGLKKTKDQASKEVLDRARKAQSEINLKLDEQRRNIESKYQKMLDETNKKLANEKSNTAKKVKAIQEKARERERNRTDRLKRADERKKLVNIANRILTTIKKPTVHKYLPQPLVKSTQKLYESLQILLRKDTPERLNVERDNALKKYTGEQLAQRLDNIDQRELAYVNSLKDFRDSIEKYAKDETNPYQDTDTYFAPIIQMIDDNIEKVGNTPPLKMNLEQLVSTKNLLRAIEKATVERNRPQTLEIKDENNKKIDTYEDIAKLAVNQANKTDLNKFIKATSSLLTGHNTMLAMGDFNPNSVMGQFAKKFDDAYLIESKIKQDLHAILDPVINEKKGKTQIAFKSEDAQKYGKENLEDVGVKDINGKPILLNHDSLMYEYENLNSDENLTHIAGGGTTYPNYKKLYGRKSQIETYGNGVRTGNIDAELTDIERQMKQAYEDEDYTTLRSLATNKANLLEQRKKELRQIRRNIGKVLTPYDKKLIKTWREIRDKGTKLLNEYWLKTCGYENFNVPNYFRIQTDPNFIKGNEGGNVQRVITNLSESGTTIARQEGARNPVISGSFIFEIEDYIDNVAKLIAYSGLQRDLDATMKYKLPGYENVQSAVKHKMPKIAENFEEMQKALFGGLEQREGKGDRVISTTRGLAARATLSPNLRVALAQIPSFLGTYRYTDGRAIKNAWLPRNQVKQSVIDKYTPLMYARGASGYSLETADLKQDTNKFVRGLNKADRLTHNWLYGIPNKMDTWTVRHTFGAYLDYARRKYPNLEEGTKEQIENGESPLYKKAAELFNEGTMRTQPMFNTFNRNSWQLSKGELAKTLTIFHTQPFQYFNLAVQDIMNYKYQAKTKGKNSQAAKIAKKAVFGSIAGILVANALFTLIKTGVDKSIRHKKDDLSALDISEQYVSTLANVFILGSTLTDAIYSLFVKHDGKIFDFEIYGTQLINELKDFAVDTSKVIDGKQVDYVKSISNILSQAGIPVANIEKDLGGIYRNIEDYVDNGMRDYSNEMNDKELLQEYILGNKSKDDLKDLGVEINDKTKFSNAVKKLYSDGEIDKDTAIKVMEDSGLYNDPKRKQSSSSYIEGKLEWWDIYNKYHDDYINGDSNEKASIRSKIALLPISNYYYHSKTNPHKRIVEYIKNNWKKTE